MSLGFGVKHEKSFGQVWVQAYFESEPSMIHRIALCKSESDDSPIRNTRNCQIKDKTTCFEKASQQPKRMQSTAINNAAANPLPKVESMTLGVTLVRGEGLAAKDRNLLGKKTTSDPYVVVELHTKSTASSETTVKQLFRTKTIKRTVNPEWNELHKLEEPLLANVLQDKENPPTLVLRIYDEDIGRKDDLMGVVTIPLEAVNKKEAKSYMIPASSAKGAKGTLVVAIESRVIFAAAPTLATIKAVTKPSIDAKTGLVPTSNTEKAFTVTVTKPSLDAKTGIGIAHHPNIGVFINNIQPNSLFAGTDLRPGCKLLSVNGFDVQSDTKEGVAALLMSSSGSVTVGAVYDSRSAEIVAAHSKTSTPPKAIRSTQTQANVSPPCQDALSAQDKADVERWKGFVAQGIPRPVLMTMMNQEGLKKALIPLVFEARPKMEQPTLTQRETAAVAMFKACLQPDEDGDLIFPPAIVVANMRNEKPPLDPKLLPIIFQGYQPAECDARMTDSEKVALRRYRLKLSQGQTPYDVARLMDREKAEPRVTFLMFSEVPTPPPSTGAVVPSHTPRFAPTPQRPAVVPSQAPRFTPAPERPPGTGFQGPHIKTEYNDVGLVKSVAYVGVTPPPMITGPVTKGGIQFGLRQAREENASNWSVRPGWDNPYFVCDRRYSNYPNIVIRGTKIAYDEIERRVQAGPHDTHFYLGDKLARDLSDPNAQEWKVRPGWDSAYKVCERSYTECRHIVVKGTNSAYKQIEARFKAEKERGAQPSHPPKDVTNFFRTMHQAQMAGTSPMSLQFNQSELARKVDNAFIANAQIRPEQEKEVVDAIRKSPLLNGKTTIRQVAAQFKNSQMKSSSLSPQLIEAILSRIVLERKFEQSDEWPPVTISFTDDSPIYGEGVREFVFEPMKLKNPTKPKESDDGIDWC